MEALIKKDNGDEDNREEVNQKIKELEPKIRVKAAALNFYLEKKKDLDKEMESEIERHQNEFDLQAIPLYLLQNEIALGTRAPTEAEIEGIEKFLTDEEKSTYKEHLNNEPLADYWPKIFATFFKDFPGLGDKDHELFKFVEKVELELYHKKNDFKLTFTFRENEYFTNTVLSKKFVYSEEKDKNDYPIRGEGTEIHWKEGKNITLKTVSKKQKNKKTGASRTVNKQVKADSFFNFFQSVTIVEGDDDIKEAMDQDFEIAKAFVEQILPAQFQLYLGIQLEDEDEFEDMEDDDEDGDDGEDDDDDEEDEKKKPKKKANRKKSGGDEKKEEGQKPECKQQ